MNHIKNVVRYWLPIVFTVTGVCGLVYLTTQQVLRMNANDPQIQMAEDSAAALDAGETPAALLPENTVDIATSLAPFLVIYDDQGIPRASSGLLHGKLPGLPPGVFQYVNEKGEDRVTWQPEPGVRVAAVVVGYGEAQRGYVMAGRSLREVEKRVDKLGMITTIAWLAMILTILVAIIILEFVFKIVQS
jgi:hypothetical protein